MSDFVETANDPLQSVSAREFGADKFCFCTDESAKLAAVWGKDSGKEQKISVFDFEKRLKFSLKGAFIYAKFEPRAQQIWLARRDNREQISVQIYNYAGGLKCELALPDELTDSDVWMERLPEAGGMAVEFGAGQDGSRTFLLSVREGELNIDPKLENNVSFLFAYAGGAKAALMNFYESELKLVSYPELKPLSAFKFPCEISVEGEMSEFMPANVAPINDEIWLVTNDADFRHYIFNAREFKFIYEIALDGFEPRPNKQGEVVSNISSVRFSGGKFIFYHYEQSERGEEINRYFTADAAEVMRNLAPCKVQNQN